MYKIRVTYKITDRGSALAELTCEEGDGGFDTAIFGGGSSCWTKTRRCESWDEVNQEIDQILEEARTYIASRRHLVAAQPPDRIIEL